MVIGNCQSIGCCLSAFVAQHVVYLPELCESELSSPHLPLAAKTVSADKLEPENDENQG